MGLRALAWTSRGPGGTREVGSRLLESGWPDPAEIGLETMANSGPFVKNSFNVPYGITNKVGS